MVTGVWTAFQLGPSKNCLSFKFSHFSYTIVIQNITYLYNSDEVRQLHKLDLTLFSYGSSNTGNNSAVTYSILKINYSLFLLLDLQKTAETGSLQ